MYFLNTKFKLNILSQTWWIDTTCKSNLALQSKGHVRDMQDVWDVHTRPRSSRLLIKTMLRNVRNSHLAWYSTRHLKMVYVYCLSKNISKFVAFTASIYTQKVTVNIFSGHPVYHLSSILWYPNKHLKKRKSVLIWGARIFKSGYCTVT